RYHSLNKTDLFPSQSFHEIKSASMDSAYVITPDSTGANGFIQRNYFYQNSYDSLSANFSITPQRYVEIELPLLLQYKLADNFSLLLGGQLAFGKIIAIQSDVQRFNAGTRLDTVSFANVPYDTANSPTSTPAPIMPSPGDYFS